MFATKVCPQCGQELFADMKVCFDCLYEFPEETVGARRRKADECGPRLRIASDALDVVVPLPEEGLVVGRGSSADIVLHSPSVSRNHVRVEPAGNGALVTDLGSHNKATVGDERVTDSRLMGPGDVLSVCGTSFVLEGGGEGLHQGDGSQVVV